MGINYKERTGTFHSVQRPVAVILLLLLHILRVLPSSPSNMSEARDIAQRPAAVTVTHALSLSPTSTFHSPSASFTPHSFGALAPATPRRAERELKPFDTQDIKILLLENVNETGREMLNVEGYQVESLKTSLPEDKLIEKIR